MDYLVQLEVVVEGRWRPVVRYDPAHGPHCDVYKLDGEDRDLAHHHLFDISTGYQEAVQAADADIERHWPDYQSNFLAGRWPK